MTGFVCAMISELLAAVPGVKDLDRRACRDRVERLFSRAAMADGYERAYAAVIGGTEQVGAWPRSCASAKVRDQSRRR